MKRTSLLLGAVSAVALTALSVSPALAAPTEAGTSITNTVTVNYKVGTLDQEAKQDTDTFLVDRKVDLLVAEIGTTTTQVTPGQDQAVTAFQITNLSNDTIDVALSAAQLVSTATAAHGGTDNFDVGTLEIWVDSDNSGDFDATLDTKISYVDELNWVDGSNTATVFVIGDVPVTQVNGDVAGVVLTGTASEGGTTDSVGATITNTSGGDTAAEDTVLADGSSLIAGDAPYDGKYSAGDDWTVLAAVLNVEKVSIVLSDPVNNTTDPKAIPGATLQYCIKVSNASGGADANTVAVSDTLPAGLTYVTGTAKLGGVDPGTGACVPGTTDGSHDGGTPGTVSGTLPLVASGATLTLVFNATID